ncbi:unnamed protein product [Arctogadus glacialis]
MRTSSPQNLFITDLPHLTKASPYQNISSPPQNLTTTEPHFTRTSSHQNLHPDQVMTWGFYSTDVTTEMMKTRNYDDDNHDPDSIADLRHE